MATMGDDYKKYFEVLEDFRSGTLFTHRELDLTSTDFLKILRIAIDKARNG